MDFVLTATPKPLTPDFVVEAVERGSRCWPRPRPPPTWTGCAAVVRGGRLRAGRGGRAVPADAVPCRPGGGGRDRRHRHADPVQVSSTQEYHAVALIRGLLGAGRGPVTVRATRFTAPLVSPLDRAGWTDDEQAKPATTTIATLDFGDGRSGLYDFTEQQTRNQLRFRRLTVRGSAGELHNDEVVRMTGPRTLVRRPLVRRQTGHDLDLIGYETEHITLGAEVLYRNPYPGHRWMDDEIAMATLLEQTAPGSAATARRPTRWPRASRTTRSRWRSSRRPTPTPRSPRPPRPDLGLTTAAR